MNKVEIRSLMRAERIKLTDAQVQEKSRKIAGSVVANFDLDSKTIHCFLPIKSLKEVDTTLLIDKIRKDYPDSRIVVPRIDMRTCEMEHVVYTEQTQMASNDYRVMEPVGGEVIPPSDIDIAIIPMLAVDKHGNRIGYGKGYYDRFLEKARHNCLKVSLSFFEPVELIDDPNEYDVPVDYCVTPEAIHTFKS